MSHVKIDLKRSEGQREVEESRARDGQPIKAEHQKGAAAWEQRNAQEKRRLNHEIGRKSRVLGRPKETNGAKEKDHAATALATTS